MSEMIAIAAGALAREAARADSGFGITGSCEEVVRQVLRSIEDLPFYMMEEGERMIDHPLDFDFRDIWKATIKEILKCPP